MLLIYDAGVFLNDLVVFITLSIIPNQGYVHSAPPRALQNCLENVDFIIEFEKNL